MRRVSRIWKFNEICEVRMSLKIKGMLEKKTRPTKVLYVMIIKRFFISDEDEGRGRELLPLKGE